jgi:predicted ATPase
VTALLAELAGGKSLPPALVERVLEKTDGIPLFIEELFTTLKESDALVEGPTSWIVAGRLDAQPLPSSLHDFLMARLDRLSPIKAVAQAGAVIGREFSFQLLATVVGLSAQKLKAALTELVSSGVRLPAQRAAGRDVHIQTRARAGRGLFVTAEAGPAKSACRRSAGS